MTEVVGVVSGERGGMGGGVFISGGGGKLRG